MRKTKEINQLLAGGFISFVFHRAKARERVEAKRKRAQGTANGTAVRRAKAREGTANIANKVTF